MKRRSLTGDEKRSAVLQLRDIELAISRLLMDTLNGKIATVDADRLVRLEMQVRKFRWKIESYHELTERLTSAERDERRELNRFWKRISPRFAPPGGDQLFKNKGN